MNIEIINEIRTSIASLQEQLSVLSSKLDELQAAACAPQVQEEEEETVPPVADEMEQHAEEGQPEEMQQELAEEEAESIEPQQIDEFDVIDISPAEEEDMLAIEPETVVSDIPAMEEEDSFMQPEPEPVEMTVEVEEIAPIAVPQEAPRAADPAKTYRWMTDMPGAPVSNVISGISLNDRVLFIRSLFGEDAVAFNAFVARINACASFAEAVEAVTSTYDWKLDSEIVYRLMMAIRRKLS